MLRPVPVLSACMLFGADICAVDMFVPPLAVWCVL